MSNFDEFKKMMAARQEKLVSDVVEAVRERRRQDAFDKKFDEVFRIQ